MTNPKKIIVEASAKHPGVLDIRDAMQQVLDYFDLLTDPGESNVVWSLIFASTNSPFTAEGSPLDLRTNAPASALVQEHVARVERGLERVWAGKPLDPDFPEGKKDVAIRLLKRNLNGIGKTTFYDDNGRTYEIAPDIAERVLTTIQDEDDEEYDYLFASFARKETGTIEGRIVDLSTDYNEPSIKLRDHRSGHEIQCRIAPEARDEIENSLTAGDIWTHRRARVRGIINYDLSGKIVRIYDCRIAFINPNEVGLKDLHDPEFTSGLQAYEYIDKLRENEFG